jgi:hypothetical protein
MGEDARIGESTGGGETEGRRRVRKSAAALVVATEGSGTVPAMVRKRRVRKTDGKLTGLGNRHGVKRRRHRFDHPHQGYSYGRSKRKQLHMCFPGFLKMLESTKRAHKRINLLLESIESAHRRIKLSKSTRVNPGLIPKKNQNCEKKEVCYQIV